MYHGMIQDWSMIVSVKNRAIETIMTGRAPKGFPADLVRSAQRKLFMIDKAVELRDLLSPPGNRLEALKGNRTGQHSIRINDQWRICFRWQDDGAHDVEIVDYH